MHIPDGFLDLRTAGATAVLAASGTGAALRHLRRGLARRKIPLMGLAAAFVFVAQMLNFPVGGGTSGHLLGATLATILLGPSAAILVMTAVLVVQCFLFADGGVLALGANLFNMALVAVLGGDAVYRGLRRLVPGPRGLLVATACAAWCSTMLAALATAGELATAGVVPWGIVFPAMANVHILIGAGEATITTLVILAIERTRPELLVDLTLPGSRLAGLVYGGLVAIGLGLFVTPFAAGTPDGLERVAATLGFAQLAVTSTHAPLTDYELPFIGSATTATWVAGLIGAVVVFATATALSTAVHPRTPGDRPATTDA